jgi:hypothetical protein
MLEMSLIIFASRLEYDSTAILITSANCKDLRPGTYYTSIGDLDSLTDFANILRQSTTVVYTPPMNWSDEYKGHSKMKEWTEDYLFAFFDKKVIKGFNFSSPKDKETMLELVDTRKTDGRQLWVAGCSITFGIGVTPAERYGQLMSNRLELPVSFLSRPASSLTWSADQILRSDIRPDDIVIWGLTSHERFPYFKNNELTHIHARYYEKDPTMRYKVDISFLDSQQLVYQAVVEIHQVINFCQKLGAEFILAQLHGRGMEKYLHGFKNYIMLADQHGRDYNDINLDLGNDQEHPGPLTHQWYCNQILDRYNKIYRNKT